MFFTTVNQMDDDQSMKKIYATWKSQGSLHTNIWRPYQNSVLVQFYTRSEERIAILSNTITRAIFIEKAVCMKTKEEFFHKVFLSPRLPRVALKANSQSGQQKQDQQEQGIRHSAVEQQDTNRRDTVKKFVQQFESHPIKESCLQDLN